MMNDMGWTGLVLIGRPISRWCLPVSGQIISLSPSACHLCQSENFNISSKANSNLPKNRINSRALYYRDQMCCDFNFQQLNECRTDVPSGIFTKGQRHQPHIRWAKQTGYYPAVQRAFKRRKNWQSAFQCVYFTHIQSVLLRLFLLLPLRGSTWPIHKRHIWVERTILTY